MTSHFHQVPPDQEETLHQTVDRVLIDNLRPGLKEVLDEALSRGVSKARILQYIRCLTGGPRAPRGGLTYLACEAYLDAKGGGQ
jgi:hypothetical protein